MLKELDLSGCSICKGLSVLSWQAKLKMVPASGVDA